MKYVMIAILITLACSLIGTPGAYAGRADQLVGAVSPEGGAYLVKRFSTSPGETITGVRFFTNQTGTIFPRIALLQGVEGALSEGSVLIERTKVKAETGHTVHVTFPPVKADGSDLYVAIGFPPSDGVRGPGDGDALAAKILKGREATSYFVDDWEGHLGTMEVDYQVDLIGSGRGGPTTEGFASDKTAELRVFLRAPSPLRAGDAVQFGVDTTSPVSLVIYGVTGRRVRTLVQETMEPGSYSMSWDGRDNGGARLSSGVYFTELVVGQVRQVQKVVLIP